MPHRCNVDEDGTRPACTGHIEVPPLASEPSVAVTMNVRSNTMFRQQPSQRPAADAGVSDAGIEDAECWTV
jgi:hypothetical protein